LTPASRPFAVGLQIDHIIPLKHRGDDHTENLAIACIDCNLAKGPNIAGIDPSDGQLVPLYHPRQDRWEEHFEWNGLRLVGTTATGRTTIEVLRMNPDEQLQLRAALRSS
jgi:hypothetical protein